MFGRSRALLFAACLCLAVSACSKSLEIEKAKAEAARAEAEKLRAQEALERFRAEQRDPKNPPANNKQPVLPPPVNPVAKEQPVLPAPINPDVDKANRAKAEERRAKASPLMVGSQLKAAFMDVPGGNEKSYRVALTAGKKYRIKAESTAVNLSAAIDKSTGLGNFTDTGNPSSRWLIGDCLADGEYIVTASSFEGGGLGLVPKRPLAGDFTLQVQPLAFCIQDTLKAEDPVDSVKQRPSKSFRVNLDAGVKYRIEIRGWSGFLNGMVGFTRLQDNGGRELGRGSAFVFDCPQTGEYSLTATSDSALFSSERTGPFTLVILKE